MQPVRHRFAVGLFVGITLLLLAGLVLAFGKLPARWSDAERYIVRFNDAPGISTGTPVRRSGIKVGEVEKVELDTESNTVRVTLRLTQQYKPRRGEIPTIQRGLLTSDTSIDWIPDRVQPLGDYLSAFQEVPGVAGSNANPMAAVQEIVPEVQRSLDQMRKSMQKLEEVGPQLSKSFEQFSKFMEESRGVVPELKNASRAFQETLKNADGTLKRGDTFLDQGSSLLKNNEPRVAKTLDNAATALDNIAQLFNEENRKNTSELLKSLNESAKGLERVAKTSEEFLLETRKTLAKVNDTLSSANDIVKDLRETTKPIGNKVEKVMDQIELASRQLAATLQDTREIVRVVSRSDGTVAKLLNDPALYNNLNQASIELMRSLPRLDRILKDVEVFADKIARHPESLGVGGALRPDSGFKEGASPIAPPAQFGIPRNRFP